MALWLSRARPSWAIRASEEFRSAAPWAPVASCSAMARMLLGADLGLAHQFRLGGGTLGHVVGGPGYFDRRGVHLLGGGRDRGSDIHRFAGRGPDRPHQLTQSGDHRPERAPQPGDLVAPPSGEFIHRPEVAQRHAGCDPFGKLERRQDRAVDPPRQPREQEEHQERKDHRLDRDLSPGTLEEAEPRRRGLPGHHRPRRQADPDQRQALGATDVLDQRKVEVRRSVQERIVGERLSDLSAGDPRHRDQSVLVHHLDQREGIRPEILRQWSAECLQRQRGPEHADRGPLVLGLRIGVTMSSTWPPAVRYGAVATVPDVSARRSQSAPPAPPESCAAVVIDECPSRP